MSLSHTYCVMHRVGSGFLFCPDALEVIAQGRARQIGRS